MKKYSIVELKTLAKQLEYADDLLKTHFGDSKKNLEIAIRLIRNVKLDLADNIKELKKVANETK